MRSRFLISIVVIAGLIVIAGLTGNLLSSCSRRPSLDRATADKLEELDRYIASRQIYYARKNGRLESLRSIIGTTANPEALYELKMNMAREFFSYSQDSTQHYLKSCQAIARDLLKDNDRYNAATIMLGHLYGKGGSYLEASQILYGQIDSASLSPALKAEYYWVLYDFCGDMAGNSGIVESLSIPPASAYLPTLFKLLPKDSPRWRITLRNKYLQERKLDSADSVSRLLLAGVKPEDRDYAIHAFFQSEIEERRGNQKQRMFWLIESAKCDLVNAVRDYASLTMVAQNILPTDVDRSFRYLRMAQEDALAYNARLRPWQISRFLMDVEDAYAKRQAEANRSAILAAIIMAALVLVLLLITRMLVARSRNLTRTQAALESSNRKLAQADKVKGDYIVNFLEGLSSQVSVIRAEDNHFRNLLKQGRADQLLKELSISGRSEKAKEEFYETFDRTFLAMYPDFPERFNALLKEEGRIYPPAGRLTTELRIFALICLGVDDSKKIASMLDYSVSTIYNYKVSVKNMALGDRDSFEKRVKELSYNL